MAVSKKSAKKFVGLPLAVVGPTDVGRLTRELDVISNGLQQQALRREDLQLPKLTKTMDDLVQLNRLNLLDEAERLRTVAFLKTVKNRAPQIHISFSAEPSPLFMEKMMVWLRANIHPLLLVKVGLQPNIGAGCMVRTVNKYFDFSLGKHFSANRELLMSKLQELGQS